jgi:hypothetical protein
MIVVSGQDAGADVATTAFHAGDDSLAWFRDHELLYAPVSAPGRPERQAASRRGATARSADPTPS